MSAFGTRSVCSILAWHNICVITIASHIGSLQCRRFLLARNLLANAQSGNFPRRGGDGASQRERGGGEEREEKAFFFSSPPPRFPSFALAPTVSFRKGYYFYSPQSSTVIKSKMVATTISRRRTRFRLPKIRLHCRLAIGDYRLDKIRCLS